MSSPFQTSHVKKIGISLYHSTFESVNYDMFLSWPKHLQDNFDAAKQQQKKIP